MAIIWPAATYEVRLEETFSPDGGTSYWQLVTGKVAGVRATKQDLIQVFIFFIFFSGTSY